VITDKFIHWLSGLYTKYVESRVFKKRLSTRLALYKVQSRDQLDSMPVNCCETLHGEASRDGAAKDSASQDLDPSACIPLIQSYSGFYIRLYRGNPSEYTHNHNSTGEGRHQALTMHGIDLKKYKDFQQYKRALGKRSSFFLRHANKALKNGYKIERFNAVNHSVDMVAIRRSMKVRSFGIMPDAWLVNVKQFGGLPEQWKQDTLPACTQHWEMLFGVFKDMPGHKQGSLITDRQLVGYARLHRIGNMLSYNDFIGDGAFIGDGVMKLLHIHIVQWVLDSGDPYASGIENVGYGSIERGSDGLFFWKKKALFAPYRVSMVEEELPEDFDPQQYLELNPDVGESNLTPAQHYQVHGRYEKRVYRRV